MADLDAVERALLRLLLPLQSFAHLLLHSVLSPFMQLTYFAWAGDTAIVARFSLASRAFDRKRQALPEEQKRGAPKRKSKLAVCHLHFLRCKITIKIS